MSKLLDISVPQDKLLSWEVKSQKPVHYNVEETKDIFNPKNVSLLSYGFGENYRHRRCLIVVDENVNCLYGEKIFSYFKHHGIITKILTIDSQESQKTMDKVFLVSREMIDFRLLRRSEPVIGIGGGVLLDIVGLAASIYRRGIPYIRIPTTLMGLIDAGIGIKTGVNFDFHKNRLGSYYPPLIAYLDREFLKTLDKRHMSNGLAEILKIALIKDKRLFELMERNAEELVSSRLQGNSDYDEIFYRAVQGMLEELQPNLWEDRLERLVDYGHSFSPSIEMKALPELLHGEAVNIDMVFSLILSNQRNLLNESDLERILYVMRCLNLPIFHDLCDDDFLQQALDDTIKHRNGLQRLPITVGLGDCVFVNDISNQEIKTGAAKFKELADRFR